MNRNIREKNSAAAGEYARKKKEQMEQAKAKREALKAAGGAPRSSLGSRGEMIMNSEQSRPLSSDFALELRNQASNAVKNPNSRPTSGSRGKVPLSRERHSAAQSHVENARYMEEFYEALKEMEGNAGPVQPGRTSLGQRNTRSPGMHQQRAQIQNCVQEQQNSSHQLSSGADDLDALKGAFGACGLTEMLNIRDDPVGQWTQGPTDPEGVLFDASDRPLFCLSLWGDEGVVGSSDHALYSFNLDTGRKTRQLYTKRHGHTEWVTACKHTSSGQVVSTGMDGKICLWPAGSNACFDIGTHEGSVSQLEVDISGKAVTCGYDQTIKVWDLKRKQQVVSLEKHSCPVLCFAYGNSRLVSGSRDGIALVWDLDQGSCIARLKAHQGHVTSLSYLQGCGGCFATGGQDGFFRVWDTRQKTTIAKIGLHRSSAGIGAVGGIQETMTGHVVTYGADNIIKVLDPRQSFSELCSFTEHSTFIYSLHTTGDLIFSGAGNGMLLCHSIFQEKLLYGLGVCEKGAVRSIVSSQTKLVAAGDDGKVLIYSF